MNRGMVIRLARLDHAMPATLPSEPGPSAFDAVAVFVAERGGQEGRESMAAALARVLGLDVRTLRDEMQSRLGR